MTNHQFGTLNAGMMERGPVRATKAKPSLEPCLQSGLPLAQVLSDAERGQVPPPRPQEEMPREQQDGSEGADPSFVSTHTPQKISSKSSFGKRPKPQGERKTQAGRTPSQQSVPAMSQRIAAFFVNDAVPAIDQPYYSGPERRKRDVSPLKERRQSRPERVKLSLRVTPSEHDWLKRASKSLGRTHQDILSVALNKYLNSLGVSPLREGESKLSPK